MFDPVCVEFVAVECRGTFHSFRMFCLYNELQWTLFALTWLWVGERAEVSNTPAQVTVLDPDVCCRLSQLLSLLQSQLYGFTGGSFQRPCG